MAELKIYTSDDARVYSGSPGTNYGSDTTIVIRRGSTTDYYDMGFLKWDLSSAPPASSIATALFYIYVTEIVDGLIDDVYTYLASTDWDEDTITYNNKPSITGNNLATFDITSIGEKSNDITDTVKDWINGVTDNYGLRLFPNTSHGYTGNEYARIASKENATTSYRPYLLINTIKGGGIQLWALCESWLKHDKIWTPKLIIPKPGYQM